MSRFQQALMSQGACNVTALANSLVRWCKEVREEGSDPANDPAVALLVYQLGYLCEVDAAHMDPDHYARLLKACEEKV